jgi:hypothetical protein
LVVFDELTRDSLSVRQRPQDAIERPHPPSSQHILALARIVLLKALKRALYLPHNIHELNIPNGQLLPPPHNLHRLSLPPLALLQRTNESLPTLHDTLSKLVRRTPRDLSHPTLDVPLKRVRTEPQHGLHLINHFID